MIFGLLILSFVVACAGANPAARETAATTVDTPRRGSDTTVTGQNAYTSADIHFISGMIGHHAQAIVISKWAPTHGASASIRTLAARIINAQQDEIASMQKWLRDRKQAVPEVSPHGIMMNMGGMQHEMTMPGMLTDDQLKQ